MPYVLKSPVNTLMYVALCITITPTAALQKIQRAAPQRISTYEAPLHRTCYHHLAPSVHVIPLQHASTRTVSTTGEQPRQTRVRQSAYRFTDGALTVVKVPNPVKPLIVRGFIKDRRPHTVLNEAETTTADLADQKRRADAEEARPFSLYRTVPVQEKPLTPLGAAEVNELASCTDFHDFMGKRYLLQLLPALIPGQQFEEIKKVLMRLYALSQQEVYRMQVEPGNTDERCVATIFLQGSNQWERDGEPFVCVEDLYTPEQGGVIFEKLLDGRLRIKVESEDLQLLRKLSPAQVNFIVDLFYLLDPVNLALIKKNHQGVVQLSQAQAQLFLSLPLSIKENIMRNYPLGINMDFIINTRSKEFMPALRRVTPYTTPPSTTERVAEEADTREVLTREEVDYLRATLTFEQMELLRGLYMKRGEEMNIDERAYAVVSLPKEMQGLLKTHYPKVKLGWIAWCAATVQNHPGKTAAFVFLTSAGVGTLCYYGPGKVAAGAAAMGAKAVPVIKMVATSNNAQRLASTAFLLATGAQVYQQLEASSSIKAL